MPDFGQRAIAAIPDRLPPAADATDGWDLSEARVYSFTFEVGKAQALPFLPQPLIRPVPAYAKILVVDGLRASGEHYREAMLLLGTREGVQIRNVLVDSLVHGGVALGAARALFGGSRRAGTVDLQVSDGEVGIAIADAAGQLCAIRMGALRECDATMLKYDALLVAGESDGAPALLRWGIRVPLTEVEGTLSRDWEVKMLRPGTDWHRLRPAYNVTAFFSHGPARIEAAHAPQPAKT